MKIEILSIFYNGVRGTVNRIGMDLVFAVKSECSILKLKRSALGEWAPKCLAPTVRVQLSYYYYYFFFVSLNKISSHAQTAAGHSMKRRSSSSSSSSCEYITRRGCTYTTGRNFCFSISWRPS